MYQYDPEKNKLEQLLSAVDQVILDSKANSGSYADLKGFVLITIDEDDTISLVYSGDNHMLLNSMERLALDIEESDDDQDEEC